MLYEVEAILDERVNSRGGTEYLIKWMGYQEEDDKTWEPAKEISKSTEIIKEWEEKKKAKGPCGSSNQDAAKAKNAKRKSGTSSVVTRQMEMSGLSGSEVSSNIGNVNDLPAILSSIMEECKKSIFEDVAKSVNEMKDRVKEKLVSEKKDVKEKFKGQEVNWKRKLEELEGKHLEEKKNLEVTAAALRAENMNLVKKRKTEEKKNSEERKQMERKIKKLEGYRLSLKNFMGYILEEEIDMDCLEDKIPRALEKIKDINDNSKKLDQIEKIFKS